MSVLDLGELLRGANDSLNQMLKGAMRVAAERDAALAEVERCSASLDASTKELRLCSEAMDAARLELDARAAEIERLKAAQAEIRDMVDDYAARDWSESRAFKEAVTAVLDKAATP